MTASPSTDVPSAAESAEADALVAAVAIAATTAADERVEQHWSEPSILPGYSVGGLAAHLLLSVERIEQVLEQPPPAVTRVLDVAEYYGRARTGDAKTEPVHRALRDAAETTAQHGFGDIAARLSNVSERLPVRLAREAGDRLVSVLLGSGGGAFIRGYLATRVVEAVVHVDDLCRSTKQRAVVFPRQVIDVAVATLLELCRARTTDLVVLRQLAGRIPLDDALRAL